MSYLSNLFLSTKLPSMKELYEIHGYPTGKIPAWNTGIPHTPETKKKISERVTGRVAHNKGVSNPRQKDIFTNNNPMHRPGVAQKVALSRKKNGIWKPHNKIETTISYICEECGTENIVRAIKHNHKRFCNKSCAASFSNKRRSR